MRCQSFLLLGSNIGDRLSYLKAARRSIENNDTSIIKVSKIYETDAWGKRDQANFLNQAIEVHTILSPIELLQHCQKIESKLARERKEKWGPRTIDIDIMYYENLIIETEELSIPQKNLENRSFALSPLHDLCPKKMHPILNKSTSILLYESRIKDAMHV